MVFYDLPFWAWPTLAAVGGFLLAMLVMLFARRGGGRDLRALLAGQEKLERTLRAEIADGQRGLRGDLEDDARALRAELLRSQENLRAVMTRDAATGREESAAGLQRFASQFGQHLQQLTESNERRMTEMRQTLEARLQALQADNGARLEEMRVTVDEKLHATLEQRLGESFRLVSERLEAVHQGLGDMRKLAAGVGDLQRVLVNVKARGTWGEVQLARLIEDVMTPEQYARNVKPIPGSDELVEFAIRLPGRVQDEPVWLPIDAKFPKEAYERLMDAHDRADEETIRQAGTAFERVVEHEGRRIAGKYVAPPHTTDFAIMFLPTEGLYAEVLRRPGLMDRLLASRINVAGPSNLAAMLNSLQMGFRTLAIEQRSSEVWQVLRAVKTEFNRFGDSLAGVKKALDSASNRIGQTEVRARAMLRNLRTVEALPDAQMPSLPGAEEDDAQAPPAP